MSTRTEVKILKEIKIPEATIRLRDDGIVHVTFNEDITLDVELQMRLVEVYNEITCKKKHPFIFNAFDGVSITKEARDNAIVIEDQAPVGATAVIADSLPYKIIANFYVKINKPKSPFKVFTNFDEGIEWIKTIKL